MIPSCASKFKSRLALVRSTAASSATSSALKPSRRRATPRCVDDCVHNDRKASKTRSLRCTKRSFPGRDRDIQKYFLLRYILSSRIEYQANDDFADELCLCHYTTAKSRCNITHKIGDELLNCRGYFAGLLAEC